MAGFKSSNSAAAPFPLIEGKYNTRLDVIKDVPPGTRIYHFEGTGIFEAKKKLAVLADC